MDKFCVLVKEFHEKFGGLVGEEPRLVSLERGEFRYRLMKEEVDEYLEGVVNGDLENVAKELADILYTVFGTVIEHGLQDKIFDVFLEVHKSNMSKKASSLKAVKGDGFVEADVGGVLDG